MGLLLLFVGVAMFFFTIYFVGWMILFIVTKILVFLQERKEAV